MTLEKPIYEEIRTKRLEDFNTGRLDIEKDFDEQPDDGARGYVLQISFEDSLTNYEKFVSDFLEIEPKQYYSPRNDLHSTVFEFVPVRLDYKNYEKYIPEYERICDTILKKFKAFTIRFQGCVFTPGSGIICGYDNDVLVKIRSEIRSEMQKMGLSLQERYQSQTAHVSFMGFKDELNDFEKFKKLVESSRNTFIDLAVVDRMEFVVHDWFNRSMTKEIISEHFLG